MADSSAAAAAGGPASGTRGIASRLPPQSNKEARTSSSAPATTMGIEGGGQAEQGESLSGPPSPQQVEEEEQKASDTAISDRDIIKHMKEEMEAMRKKLERMEQQSQQPSLSPIYLSSPASPSPSDLEAFFRVIQQGQVQHLEEARKQQEAIAEQLRKQQAASAAQQLVLRSLGELPTFSGKGSDTTLIAQEWLQRAERYFAVREQALGIDAALGDDARKLNAAYALQDDARRWYDALPKQPSTWVEFSQAIKARFCSVPSERIRVEKLREFVDKAAKLRDKLNVQGMQAFTARFTQLAGEVSDKFLTDHGRLELLARGVPQRYAEVVMKEDAKEPPTPLHDVINMVLARASQKEQAASFGASSATAASAAPLNLDAISRAVATFGWTQEEAQQHLQEGEGWTPHDTYGNPLQHASGSSSSVVAPSPSYPPVTREQMEQFLSAMSRVGAGPAGRERHAQSRRSVPEGVHKEVPAELAKSRMEAGLCIKCGVAKYEGGGKGHNSRTCKAPVDKTTSAAEGRKKANF
jgi:hypothetical protein